MNRYKPPVVLAILAMLALAPVPGQASALHAAAPSIAYMGDSYDYAWTAEPAPGGGFILAITTQSFGVPSYGRYAGALWLLHIDGSGQVLGSTIYVAPYPAIYYDSAILGDSIVVVGSSYDYQRAVVARIGLDGTPVFFMEVTPTPRAWAPILTAVEVIGDRIYGIGIFYDSGLGRAMQWVVELDPSGVVLSSMGFSLAAPYSWPIPFSVDAYGPDGLVIAGYGYRAPGYVMAVNTTSWSVEWAYSVGDNSGEDFYGVIYEGGSVVLVGATDDYGSEDLILVNMSSGGTLNWAYRIYSPGTDRGFGLYYRDGYVYASGWAQPDPAGYGNDTVVAKVSSTGSVEWVRLLGDRGDDWAYRLYVDEDGYTYAIGGITYAAKDDPYIARITPNGDPPYCLDRGDTLGVEPYTTTITGVAATPYNYTSTTTTASLSLSILQASPMPYAVCPAALVGGEAIIDTGSAVEWRLVLAALLLLAAARTSKGRR